MNMDSIPLFSSALQGRLCHPIKQGRSSEVVVDVIAKKSGVGIKLRVFFRMFSRNLRALWMTWAFS